MRMKKYYKENILVKEDGTRFRVEYRIVFDSTSENTSYGLSISSYDTTGILDEFVEILNITQNFVEIQTLFMVLYKYKVTPVTLYDVLDDCLDDLNSLEAIIN